MRKPPPLLYPCFYPTRVAFCDDEESFLKALHQSLFFEKDFTFTYHQNPDKLVKHLNDKHDQVSYIKTSVYTSEDEDEDIPTKKDIKIDLNRIKDIIHNPNRFADVSLVYMDLKMPEGSGKDFLQQIVNNSIVKGLFTGFMDYGNAIEAFNANEIETFINKGEEDVGASLAKQIKNGAKLYFSYLVPEIIKRSYKLNKVLANTKFITKFNEIVKNENICEYYLLDNNGSYLLLTENAEGKILAVMLEEEIEAFYQLAEMADNKPSTEVLKALKDHKKFPFILNINPESFDIGDIDKCLVDATKVERTDIYFSLIDDIDRYEVDLEDVKSFAEYKKEFKDFKLSDD